MLQQGEFQGFINVKITSRVKSMNFLPWKTWRNQWVIVRRSKTSTNGVELVIGRSSQSILQITSEDIICRTESRTQNYAFGIFSSQNKYRANIYLSGISETDSQRWISGIRNLLKPSLLPVEKNEFAVAIIDNFFSKAAGLYGLYGTLKITGDSVIIIDPSTSKNKVEWAWSDLSTFHISSAIAREDKGRICTIITSRKFLAGVGQIHLYCTDSMRLIKTLQAQNKSAKFEPLIETQLSAPYLCDTFKNSKNKSNGLSSSSFSKSHRSSSPFRRPLSRRLSRSEDNLLSAFTKEENISFKNNCYNNLHDSRDKYSPILKDCSIGSGKVAPGIISAGLSLILSPTKESERVQTNKFTPARRESGVSVASGAYEEINDAPFNLEFSSLDVVTENEFECPPPLPPRRNLFKNVFKEDIEDESPNLVQVPLNFNYFLLKSDENSSFSSSSPNLSVDVIGSQGALSSSGDSCAKNSLWFCANENDYLPMLPTCKYFHVNDKIDFSSECAEDENYMTMTGIKLN